MTDFRELVEEPSPRAGGVEGETHGTTVLCLRYDGGVLTLSDRRATAGNLIMYDQADKVSALDDTMVIAISGAFGRAVEAIRFLKHSFAYYRRSVLHEMSTEGKLAEISRAIAGNAPVAAQGIGFFLPIVAAYDPKKDRFGLYFFDGSGARFENASYACAGSGSERIRGVFEYIERTQGRFETLPLETVLYEGLRMLDIAADLDSATGGFGKTPPIARVLDRDGTREVDAEILRAATTRVLTAA